jgi:hypothetical protein
VDVLSNHILQSCTPLYCGARLDYGNYDLVTKEELEKGEAKNVANFVIWQNRDLKK